MYKLTIIMFFFILSDMNSDFEDEGTQGDLQSKGLFGQLQARLGRSLILG